LSGPSPKPIPVHTQIFAKAVLTADRTRGFAGEFVDSLQGKPRFIELFGMPAVLSSIIDSPITAEGHKS
jgi:hypothetical protein